ncbi:MAG: DUF559 domain-containing protein, partial [Candidatus Cloacimonetes bacterium]|nr:DUF559 domain-containing protein [Candidatus Cloacimonadota bacterium]
MNNTKLKQLILKVLKSDERLWNSPCGVENTQRGKDKTELNQTLLLDLVENIDEKVINLLLQEKDLREKFFAKINKKFPSDRGVASRSDDGVFVFKTNDFRFFMEENKVDNSYTQYKNRIGLTDSKRFLKDTNDVVLDFPYKDCVLEGGQSTEEGKDNYFDWQDTTYKDKLDEHGKKIKTGRRNVKVVDEEGHYEQITTKRKEIFFNSVLAHNEIDRLFDHKALTNWKRFTKDGEIPLFEGCPQGGVETKDTRPEWQKRSLFQFWNLPKNKKLNQRAKELRKQGILSEVLFWKSFKEKEKIKGYDIDRQVIIGNFIVDFFIAELGLVIEIDGSSHDDKQEYDKERQAFLEGLNLQVVRYSDIKVKKNINGVYEDLLKNIEVREKELSTSPAKAGTLQEENKSTPSNSTNLPPLKRGIDGTIKENLIIKGNNLLALHSLKKQFAGKVKLIYIDPPYNTGNDGFKYN